MVRTAKRSLAPRRLPQQERSRKRVTAIVEATRRLVGRQGNAAVSVRDIAAEAGVPIASVYQYFPDKNAILRQLVVEYIGGIQQLLEPHFCVEDPADLLAGIEAGIDALHEMMRHDSSVATIWASVQANPVLRKLDYQDARKFGMWLVAVIGPHMTAGSDDDVFDTLLYSAHIVPWVLGLAQNAPRDDARRLVREVKAQVLLRIGCLMGSS